ncbi:hypothetical protein ACOMHN_031182 [Nucella lapillus]
MAIFDENSESQESYTNTAKRAKKPNFSDQEMEVLIEEVALDAKLLFSSFQNGITNAKKKFAWLRITTRVNAVGANGRTPEQIKKRWKDVKQAVIKRKQQLAETGGRHFCLDLNQSRRFEFSIVPFTFPITSSTLI